MVCPTSHIFSPCYAFAQTQTQTQTHTRFLISPQTPPVKFLSAPACSRFHRTKRRPAMSKTCWLRCTAASERKNSCGTSSIMRGCLMQRRMTPSSRKRASEAIWRGVPFFFLLLLFFFFLALLSPNQATKCVCVCVCACVYKCAGKCQETQGMLSCVLVSLFSCGLGLFSLLVT